MLTFVTIVHVLLCVFMIFVILLQPGKDAGMGATLGGGAATSAFGGRGAVTFLSKVTAICATLFFITSLGLSFVGLRSSVAAGHSVAAPPASTPAAVAADAGTVSETPAEPADPVAAPPAAPQDTAAPVPVPAPTTPPATDSTKTPQ